MKCHTAISLLALIQHGAVAYSHTPTGRTSSAVATSVEDLGVSPDFTRRAWLQSSLIATTGILQATTTIPKSAIASYIDPSINPPKITRRVYLDVEIPGAVQSPGRIIIGLYGDLMPRTCENFATLCVEKRYKGTSFYRVLSDYSLQGGAVGDPSGRTGLSSFENGKPFEPDNFDIQHTKKGLVSMVRRPDGSADSRFFVSCSDNGGWADDRYAAFGIVEDETSLKLVSTIEKVPVSPPKNNPKQDVIIVDCGVLPDDA